MEAARIASLATKEASDALGNIIDQSFGTLDDAAKAWADIVNAISIKYDAELASRFFEVGGSRYVFGSVTSDGYINKFNHEYGGVRLFGRVVTYIHILQIACLVGRICNLHILCTRSQECQCIKVLILFSREGLFTHGQRHLGRLGQG